MKMNTKIAFKNPKGHDEFLSIIKSEYPDYDLVARYSMMNGRTNFKHLKCGTIFKTTPYKFIFDGNGCPECSDDVSHVYEQKEKEAIIEKKEGSYRKHLKFIKKVIGKYGIDRYEIVERFIDDNIPIEIMHLKCKHKFRRAPAEIISVNIMCPSCEISNRKEWTIAKIKRHIKKLTDGEFEVVSKEYKNIDIPIYIKHNVCGKRFKVSANTFMKCPKCKVCEGGISLNEKIIRDYLISKQVDFEREYKFDDCRNKSKLGFDFALFNKSKELVCLIEYDGEQHYRPIFDEKSFIRTLVSDDIKNKYCRENDIDLIRIPYWESENMEKILNKIIRKYKLN